MEFSFENRYDRDLVKSFTDELITRDFYDIATYFRSVDGPTPEILWSPTSAELDEGALRVLLDYWIELPRGQDLPLASVLDPLQIRGALGLVMLLDVEDDGWDYRYRVYGTTIAERSGFDATGKLISELDLQPMGPFFIASYRACFESRGYMFSRHVPPLRSHTTSWDRIILPLEGEGGQINRLLVGNVPGTWRAEVS